MPELPEVEQFRRLLLPLCSASQPVVITPEQHNPPRSWPTPEQFDSIADTCYCVDVLRKGKQLCMVLTQQDSNGKENLRYMYLHMGMTGRITTKASTCRFGSVDFKVETAWPPRFTYLTFQMGDYTACFSDPRKFGSCLLADDCTAFDLLAPDAWTASDHEVDSIVLPKLIEQRLGIKALLLDQKRACCGVGNWVADEVLYQVEIHPDQAFLTEKQAGAVWTQLRSILSTAVDCLDKDLDYPKEWLFRYRWTKKRAGKDYQGRSITFVTSGGRTSAIISTLQKLSKSQGKQKEATGATKRKQKVSSTTEKEDEQERPSRRVKKEVAEVKAVPTAKDPPGTSAVRTTRRKSARRLITP